MAKAFRVAEARARFGEILDEAEKGGDVFIERRGVRFRVVADRARSRKRTGTRLFDHVDPAVASGRWTWEPASGGVRFTPRRRRR